ncbi:hypothetical protein BH24ACT13_BH24ACT13_02960 [soil metagenome]
MKNIMSAAVPATSSLDAGHGARRALAGVAASVRTRVLVPSTALPSVPTAARTTDSIAYSAFGNGTSDPRTRSHPV